MPQLIGTQFMATKVSAAAAYAKPGKREKGVLRTRNRQKAKLGAFEDRLQTRTLHRRLQSSLLRAKELHEDRMITGGDRGRVGRSTGSLATFLGGALFAGGAQMFRIRSLLWVASLSFVLRESLAL